MALATTAHERRVEHFLDALQHGRLAELGALLADGVAGRFPFSSGLFPLVIAGKAELTAHFQAAFDAFDRMAFVVTALSSDDRNDQVFARFTGTGAIAGRPNYANTYLMMFTFDRSGSIIEIVEYYNPMITGSYFGLITVEPALDGVSLML